MEYDQSLADAYVFVAIERNTVLKVVWTADGTVALMTLSESTWCEVNIPSGNTAVAPAKWPP